MPGILPFRERLGSNAVFFFLNRDDLIGRDILEVIDLPAGPANFDGIGPSMRAQTEGQYQFAGRKIAYSAKPPLIIKLGQ